MDGRDDDTVIMNAQEICRAIFAESLQRTQDIFFPNAARALLAAIIVNAIRLRKQGLIGVDKLTKAKAQYIAGGTEQAQGVLSELYNAIGDLFIKVFGDEGNFSVRNFVRKRGGRILWQVLWAECTSSSTN